MFARDLSGDWLAKSAYHIQCPAKVSTVVWPVWSLFAKRLTPGKGSPSQRAVGRQRAEGMCWGLGLVF